MDLVPSFLFCLFLKTSICVTKVQPNISYVKRAYFSKSKEILINAKLLFQNPKIKIKTVVFACL
jgi:hypothetical protein